MLTGPFQLCCPVDLTPEEGTPLWGFQLSCKDSGLVTQAIPAFPASAQQSLLQPLLTEGIGKMQKEGEKDPKSRCSL